MADKFDAELERIRELLRAAVTANRYTVRALEREMGTTIGITRKVLNGQITLSYRRVLEILDALGLSWTDFFQAAYPPSGAEAPPPSLKMAPRLGLDPHPQATAAPPHSPLALEAEAAPEEPGRAALLEAARLQVLKELITLLLGDKKPE